MSRKAVVRRVSGATYSAFSRNALKPGRVEGALCFALGAVSRYINAQQGEKCTWGGQG